jgi:hypothetical protein
MSHVLYTRAALLYDLALSAHIYSQRSQSFFSFLRLRYQYNKRSVTRPTLCSNVSHKAKVLISAFYYSRLLIFIYKRQYLLLSPYIYSLVFLLFHLLSLIVCLYVRAYYMLLVYILGLRKKVICLFSLKSHY